MGEYVWMDGCDWTGIENTGTGIVVTFFLTT